MSKKEKSKLYTNSKDLNLKTQIQKRPWKPHSNHSGETYRCHCREKLIDKEKDITKLNRTGLSNGKPLRYQDFEEEFLKTIQLNNTPLTGQFLKTFQIQSTHYFSLTARSLLLSFTNKYIYYAIDDILYMSNLNPMERKYLLDILYSSMLSLHNDFSTNFFDIWIDSVYLTTDLVENRFLKDRTNPLSQFSKTTITLKLHYFTRTPIKKPESIW